MNGARLVLNARKCVDLIRLVLNDATRRSEGFRRDGAHIVVQLLLFGTLWYGNEGRDSLAGQAELGLTIADHGGRQRMRLDKAVLGVLPGDRVVELCQIDIDEA